MTSDNGGKPADNENIKFGADRNEQKKTIDADDALDVEMPYGATAEGGELGNDGEFQTPEGFPDMDETMLGQVQEMMGKLQKADELEKENADLKFRLGRLAADFEGYRHRTGQEATEAEGRGVSRAAEALMPVYDDVERALSMGTDDPAKLIPGMQAVQNKVLSVFAGLGLEATGREGETFDPQWHEAIQVVPGDEDDRIVTVYQLGFRLGDRLVRPARVVVSRRG
ncbi:molecular chaperone GrpE [Deinococcus reticulitermitis]|uniref:Protein GrpE n=1 Tax=Deinococcus reticulitermitis TaxID=856736 RepID=A0A1H6U5X6_9DEIO|nr:nucleotide exchange factor GrpE [Deinococcus reticulitermitis]SEI87713.1 molecular chaperone GrpE [Deinococcus reticulitermitis]